MKKTDLVLTIIGVTLLAFMICLNFRPVTAMIWGHFDKAQNSE